MKEAEEKQNNQIIHKDHQSKIKSQGTLQRIFLRVNCPLLFRDH